MRPFGRSSSPEPPGEETIRSLFSKFRRILSMNNRSLEIMAEMERALGGEYIFDRNYLELSVRELGDMVHQTAYSLNAMAANRYVGILDRFEEIKNTLADILEGGLGPWSHLLTAAADSIGWEMEPMVGFELTCLSEIRRQTGMSAPDGFVITVTGVDRLLKGNPDFQNELRVPPELRDAVNGEIDSLRRRQNQELLLAVRAVPVALPYGENSFGTPGTLDNISSRQFFTACREALKNLLARVKAQDSPNGLRAVIHATANIRPHLSGRIFTRDPVRPTDELVLIEAEPAPQEGPGDGSGRERYRLRRFEPYDLVESEIVVKNKYVTHMPFERKAGYRPGSSLAPPGLLKSIVEAAMAIDRMVGRSLRADWVLTEEGALMILGFELLSIDRNEKTLAEDLEREIASAKVLLKGGETAQFGVAAGRVIPISEDDDPNRFPLGAVALARLASPRFTPFLKRASAFISETGSAAGHLATVARECRAPAIVGAAGAMASLTPLTEVTVDAEEGVVYEGVLEALLRYRSTGLDLAPTDPEYLLLRRLLRWITPLNLIDPESTTFNPASCRTFHDLLHLVHEKAVEELVHIQARHPGMQSLVSRPLALSVPFDIRLLDIDGGLAPDAGTPVETGAVDCLPLLALLRGLNSKYPQESRPVALGLKDIISGMGRTEALLNATPAHAGSNLAIISRFYMNLSLRLGYHFNVIDAHFQDPLFGPSGRNTVYFRFAGGFAEPRRRRRRAELIRLVLEMLNFQVTVTGDLVVGKLKEADQPTAESVLSRLGELISFTRQLDVAMADDQDIESMLNLFLIRIGTNDGDRIQDAETS